MCPQGGRPWVFFSGEWWGGAEPHVALGPPLWGTQSWCSARPDEEHVLGETGVLPALSSTKVPLGAERKDGETVWAVGK